MLPTDYLKLNLLNFVEKKKYITFATDLETVLDIYLNYIFMKEMSAVQGNQVRDLSCSCSCNSHYMHQHDCHWNETSCGFASSGKALA